MYDTNTIHLDASNIVRDKSTSDGSQIKYYKDNKWYKVDNVGGEAESEVLSTILLECSNISPESFVHYSKILINNQPGCVSDDFRTSPYCEEFVTLYRLYKNVSGHDLATITSKMDYDDAIMYVIDFVKKTTGLDITTYLANTFYLDEIILNTDRHFNNYGIIMSENGYKEAPIFDNGKSLLTGLKHDLSIPMEKLIKNVYSKSFSPSFSLNSNYLKQYRCLEINKEKVLEQLKDYPDSLQKDVLFYQVNKLLKY